jgi:hypothetical protein
VSLFLGKYKEIYLNKSITSHLFCDDPFVINKISRNRGEYY